MFRFFLNFEYGFDLDQSVRKKTDEPGQEPDYKWLQKTTGNYKAGNVLNCV